MFARMALSLVMLLAAGLAAPAIRASDYPILPTRAAPPNSAPLPPVNAVPLPAAPVNAVPVAPPYGSPLVGAPAGPAEASGSSGHFYAQVDYLFAWLETGRVGPLVTTTTTNLPRGLAGVEGVPGNAVLFGDRAICEDPRSGLLLRFGYQLDSACREGFEFGLLVVGREGDELTAASDGSPGSRVLARPFSNTQTGTGDADLIAFPGLLAGSVRVRTASDLVGTEVNYRAALSSLSCGWCGCGEGGTCSGRTVDFLIGYRSARYRDKITVDTLRSNLTPAAPVTTFPVVHDSFYSKTLFNGVQFGLEGRLERESFFLAGRATAALGMSSSRTDVSGFSDVIVGGQVVRQQAGLLAGLTNIGHYGDDDTAFLSELTLRAGYKVGSNLTLTVGYTALYLSSVVRSGDLIDRTVNTTQLPPGTLTGTPRPAVIIQNEDVWMHALSLGMEWKY